MRALFRKLFGVVLALVCQVNGRAQADHQAPSAAQVRAPATAGISRPSSPKPEGIPFYTEIDILGRDDAGFSGRP